MNYAAVINTPFTSNANAGDNNYSRISYAANGYGPQNNMMGQPPAMMQQPAISSGTGQQLNMFRSFSHAAQNKDPRNNTAVGSKLFVGQVPAMTTEQQLRPVFEVYGSLLEVKIMRDRLGRSKGSAWVRYETDEMARSAIAALHEKHIVPPQTNPLRVQFATPNTNRNRLQNKYPMEMGGQSGQYNFAGPMGGGSAPSNGMMMMRPGAAAANVVPPITQSGNGRYMPPLVNGPMGNSSVMTGSYTSAVHRFENNDNSRRDFSYSFQEQTPAFSAVPYQQQRFFPSSLTGQSNIYAAHQIIGRGSSASAFEAMQQSGSPTNNVSTSDMPTSLDQGVSWEGRNNTQDMREATGNRMRHGERRDE